MDRDTPLLLTAGGGQNPTSTHKKREYEAGTTPNLRLSGYDVTKVSADHANF